MALLRIPVRCDVPAYEFQITLDEKIYNLSFAWSDRSQLWTMDIADENSVDLLVGIPLFTNFDLIGRFRDSRLPPRTFFCQDTADEGKNAGVDDLGSRVILLYGDDT